MRLHWPVLVYVLLLCSFVTQAQPATPTALPTPPPPRVLATVNDTPITAEAFRTRLETEVWLLSREVSGFATSFYAQNGDADSLMETIGTVYGVQLAALDDTPAFAETVLNSLIVDRVLADLAIEQEIVVTEDQVEVAIREHITLADGLDTPPDDEALMRFFEAAEAATGADEATVRDLFRGRVLREVFYRAVTETEDNAQRTQAQNQQFRQWAFAQVQAADVTRQENWREVIPQDANYRDQVTDAVAEVLAEALVP